MSDSFCPSCDATLPSDAINIAEGVALCPACGKLSRLSDVVEYERPTAEVINAPPPGCTLNNEINSTVIRISMRSFGGCLGSLAVCLFWNGITGLFVLSAIAALYSNLVGPIPAWFPAPTMDNDMSLGMAIFLCLFMTPFVTIGTIMFGAVLMNMMGSMIVSVGRDEASVSTGAGPFRWTKRFDPRTVQRISTGKSKVEVNGQHKALIEIVANRTVRFGSTLSESKRDWLIAVLRRLLKDAS